jgi:hypothetical protein
MKKVFAILIFIISSSIFTSAQAFCEQTPKPFAPAHEEFSVSAPEALKLLVPIKNDDSERFYKLQSCGAYFFITSDLQSEDNKSKYSRFQIIYEYALANKAKITEKLLDNLTGDFFEFTDTEGFHHQILAINAKSRFYMFHTVSETESTNEIENFFSSIKLNRILLEDNQNKKSENQTNKSNVGYGTGGGTGSGSGNDAGGGISGSLNSNTDSTKKRTSGIQILSKPSAKYLDIARLYDISGSVQLKIVFLANGTIGSITTVTKLPFGLTNSAIDAARALKFEPAMREGVPYPVVKTVVYSFTIY